MLPSIALLIILSASSSAERLTFMNDSVLLDNGPDDRGCCSIQKIKGTKTWDCNQDTRKNCAQTVKDLGLDREFSRWNFDKEKSCGDVPNCK